MKFPTPGTFVRLCDNKGIVYVHSVNEQQNIFHGFNVSSPNLKMMNYPIVDYDKAWQPNTTEVNNAVPKEGYSTTDCRFHPAATTQSRYELLRRAIRDVPHVNPI